MSRRTSVLEVLEELYGVKVETMLYGVFVALSVLFATTSILLSLYASHTWSPSFIFTCHETEEGSFFYKCTNDVFLVCLFVVFVFPIFAFLASIQYRVNADADEPKPLTTCACFRCYYACPCLNGNKTKHDYSKLLDTNTTSSDEESKSFNSHSASGGGQPLLKSLLHEHKVVEVDVESNTGGAGGSPDSSSSNSTAPIAVTSEEGFEAEDELKAEEEKSSDSNILKMKMAKDQYRDLCLGMLFVCSTTAQIYVGLKCISFDFQKDEKRDGALMGLSVLWINLIVWVLNEIVSTNSRELGGELLPLLHPHRLHLNLIVAGHWCDKCRTPCEGGRAYRCALCDFDLCLRCYAKRNKGNVEGQIRTDKGVKVEECLSSTSYFWRGVSLVQSEKHLFALAMLFLLLANGASLLAPTIQGSILDAVVTSNHNKFEEWVKLYILTSLASAVFASIKGLCFNIIGRRLTNTLRITLFQGIIVQDVIAHTHTHTHHATNTCLHTHTPHTRHTHIHICHTTTHSPHAPHTNTRHTHR